MLVISLSTGSLCEVERSSVVKGFSSSDLTTGFTKNSSIKGSPKSL